MDERQGNEIGDTHSYLGKFGNGSSSFQTPLCLVMLATTFTAISEPLLVGQPHGHESLPALELHSDHRKRQRFTKQVT
jgi:hypothetical protein